MTDYTSELSPSANVADLNRISDAEALSLVDETLGRAWPSSDLLEYRFKEQFQEDWKGQIGQVLGTARRFKFLEKMVRPLLGERARRRRSEGIDPNDRTHLKLHHYFAAGIFCHYFTGTGWNFGAWEPETGGTIDIDLALTTPSGTLVEWQIKAPDQPGRLVDGRYRDGNYDERIVTAIENAASQLRCSPKVPALIGLFPLRSLSLSWNASCLTTHLFGSTISVPGGATYLQHHQFGRFLYGWRHVAGVVAIDFLRGESIAKYACTVLLNPHAIYPLAPDCFPRARVVTLDQDTFRWRRGAPQLTFLPSGTRVVERLHV